MTILKAFSAVIALSLAGVASTASAATLDCCADEPACCDQGAPCCDDSATAPVNDRAQ